jgi:hypothetical protein
MLKYEVVNFNLNSVNQLINSDITSFLLDFEAFSKRDFTLTEAKIDLDRKSLYHWKKVGLLPFSVTPQKRGENKTWGRFSFIELCWLRMLIDLRGVGISLEKLQKIKELLFPDNFIDTFFSKPVDDIDSINPELQKVLVEKGILVDGFIRITPDLRKSVEQLQFSLFSCTLYSLILTRGNYVFVGMGNESYEVINLNDFLSEPTISILDVYNMLSDETKFFINIKKIVADLSDTHNHFINSTRLGQCMALGALDKLKELFENGDVKEVIIKINDNGTKSLQVKKIGIMEDLYKELRRLRKKGNYGDLLIKTRDGNTQYFEHKEIIKL